jgi:hypothetical protein
MGWGLGLGGRREYLAFLQQLLVWSPLNRRRLAAHEDGLRLLLALAYAAALAAPPGTPAEVAAMPYLDLLGFLGVYSVRPSDCRVVRGVDRTCAQRCSGSSLMDGVVGGVRVCVCVCVCVCVGGGGGGHQIKS